MIEVGQPSAKPLHIASMALMAVGTVRMVETFMRGHEQTTLPVRHVLHAGLYARSVTVPAGVMITGALVKIPTVLIVSGDCGIWLGNEFLRVKGYRVFSAGAHRKQIFIAKSDTDLTMCFPTDAKTVREAEEQFTDEAHLLQNRGS